MIRIFYIFIVFLFINFASYKSLAEEENLNSVLEQLQNLQKDISTLEKAVYSKDISSQNSSSSGNNEDALTRHLLKLSELEEQFRNLTNQFEEINFKIDRLSNRITKIQTDNQMRFQDIERGNVSSTSGLTEAEPKKLPGSGEAQILGKVSDEDLVDTNMVQKTQSVESAGTVLTEKAVREEKLLPDASPEKQYEFAISFLKIGDYETAELALREFVDSNQEHDLAGNAQYWYGETFRIRQLYQDAATAYLDGYQKYPKSSKAPVNLLKLGVTLVQIGEKEQGCSMISGVIKQYPEASQSIAQKAEYEKKKFNCDKQS